MAVGVEKNPVLCLTAAAVGAPNDMVVVPTREFGDLLVADGAEAVLFFPEAKQLSPTFQVIYHLHAEAFFEVEFPLRVIGVRIAFNLGTSFNRRIRG